jgi:hypothetical protein
MDNRVLDLIAKLKDCADVIDHADKWITEYRRCIDEYAEKLKCAEMRKINQEKEMEKLLNELTEIRNEKA